MKISWRLTAKDEAAVKDGALRCSFCTKAQEEVAKLIAGPEVYICNECVQVCQVIIEEETHVQEHHEQERRTDEYAPVACSLCGVLTPSSSALLLENRGLLCPVCLEAIQAAVSARDERDLDS